jgi:hypothetical protein
VANLYRVETFEPSALDETGPDEGNELEHRLNALATQGWKVVTMTSDDDGYIVILQHVRQTRKRTAAAAAADARGA